LGTIPLAILTDASNNVGIGAAPSGSYKLDVTGTAKVSSTLLVSGALTGAGEILNSGGQLAFSGSGGAPSTGIGIRYNGTFYVYAGANGFNVRNSANSANNFVVADNGVSTFNGGQINITGSGTSIQLQGTSYGNIAADKTLYLDSGASSDMILRTNGGTERMRITYAGWSKISNSGTYLGVASPYHEIASNQNNNAAVVVTNSNNTYPYGVYMLFTGTSPNDSTRWFYNGEDTTATRFVVRSNGGIANYTANDVNLSDERVKKDISLLGSYWDKFKAIEIVKFKYKDQTHDDFNIGVIAQQVEEVAPEFVDIDGFGKTPEDGIPLKSVYTSDLHHATIKVLQEAMAKIEELNERLNKAGL
jgi:hypothetical protein